MTTMLERAARAAMTVCVGFNEEGDDVYVGPNTAEELARAVLMAVRVPSGVVLEAEDQRQWDVHGWMYAPPKETFTAMIDAILEGK